MTQSEQHLGSRTEQFSDVNIPPARMIGNPTRFLNIYEVQPETILLDGDVIPAQQITISVEKNQTKSLAYYTDDPAEAKQGTIGAKVRTAVETMLDGPRLDMGSRVVYDARQFFNGNIAHVLGTHFAKLGFAREKLGIEPGDCIVVLEKKSPPVSHRLFDFIGYETCETNRPVSGYVLGVDVKRYDPYHLYPYVANVEPEGLAPGGHDKLFISRRSSRRIENERELIQMAEGAGYTVVYFEDEPLARQWSLVRDARSIIGIHGAALGYLCTKGKPASGNGGPILEPSYELLEILSPGLVADIYRKASAVLGGLWVGCRGRLSSKFVKVVDESTNFRSLEARDFYLHPDALGSALNTLSAYRSEFMMRPDKSY